MTQPAPFHIFLYQPEIPANSGNIIRLCANSGAQLHFIHPLGFTLDDKRLRRAGLDYHEWAHHSQHDSLDAALDAVQPTRLFLCSTKGTRTHDAPCYQAGDGFMFGPETRGLPASILDTADPDAILRIPMLPHSRSLNLSNAVAVILFEAWRQVGW